MSKPANTTEFKEQVVREIVQRAYPVFEVSERLAAAVHSLYKQEKAVQLDKS